MCILMDVGFLYALYVCLHTDYICLARNDFKDRWNKKKIWQLHSGAVIYPNPTHTNALPVMRL